MADPKQATTTEVQTTAEDRLPWHKPEITRLQVSLDTRFNNGTNTDGHTGSTGG